jgi:hypothetical protein
VVSLRAGLALFWLALAVACAGGGPAFETVATLPTAARHPAGADSDPAPRLPPKERRGDAESGLLVLETPADPTAARAVIAAFFRAIVSESPSGLAAVLAPNATLQEGSRREGAASAWAGRFSRFDYRSLAGEPLYRDAAILMREDDGDIWARVPLEISWGARPRVLGDDMTLRLTPSGSSWSIAEIIEEFRTP